MKPIKLALLIWVLYVASLFILANSTKYIITYQVNEGCDVEIVEEGRLDVVLDSLENNQRTIYSVEPY